MNREDIDKLLGGYATGTLTPEEREALFAAALEDQQIFEALAREEPLRELLQDPFAKTRLLTALEQKPEPRYRRWLRPAVWAIPAAGLAAVVALLVLERPPARQPVTIAQVLRPRSEPAVPVPSPLPQVLEKRTLPAPAREVEPRARARPAEPLIAVAPPPPPPALEPALPPPPKDAEPQADAAVLGATQIIAGPSQRANRPRVNMLRTQSLPVQAAGQQGQAGVAGYAPSSDARALYYGTPFPPVFQTNLAEPQTRIRPATPPPRAAAVTATPVTLPMQHLGLRYSILRRGADGQVAAVDPNGPIDPGGNISLRFESNETGYLYVFERIDGWRLFASSRIERSTPYNLPQTGGLVFDGSRPKELFVVFSRQPQQTPYPAPEARLDQLMSGDFTEGATYVVSTGAVVPAQILAFPVTLTQK
jgi:hypothetical protein